MKTRTTKRCPQCGQTKLRAEYGVNKSRADGLQDRCKQCHNQLKTKNHKDREKPGQVKNTPFPVDAFAEEAGWRLGPTSPQIVKHRATCPRCHNEIVDCVYGPQVVLMCHRCRFVWPTRLYWNARNQGAAWMVANLTEYQLDAPPERMPREEDAA